MLEEFDKLVQQRRELMLWWSLGKTIARYDRQLHSLRIDVSAPRMIAFCGQEYAGAKNYHESPDFFVKALRDEMQLAAKEIAQRAYDKEIARLDAAIEKHRQAVLAQLDAGVNATTIS